MTQRTRLLIALGILALVALVVLGLDALQRRSTEGADLPTGSVPLYRNGTLVAAVVADDLAGLEEGSFVDAEEGKTQQGWWVRDILRLYLPEEDLQPDTTITVISSSRQKQAVLTWAEADDTANVVLFDLSNRGTLKLVSVLPSLDTRDEWVQDVDRIEVTVP